MFVAATDDDDDDDEVEIYMTISIRIEACSRSTHIERENYVKSRLIFKIP